MHPDAVLPPRTAGREVFQSDSSAAQDAKAASRARRWPHV